MNTDIPKLHERIKSALNEILLLSRERIAEDEIEERWADMFLSELYVNLLDEIERLETE